MTPHGDGAHSSDFLSAIKVTSARSSFGQLSKRSEGVLIGVPLKCLEAINLSSDFSQPSHRVVPTLLSLVLENTEEFEVYCLR